MSHEDKLVFPLPHRQELGINLWTFVACQGVGAALTRAHQQFDAAGESTNAELRARCKHEAKWLVKMAKYVIEEMEAPGPEE